MRRQQVRAAVWFVIVPLCAVAIALVATHPPFPFAAAERVAEAAAFQVLGPQPQGNPAVVVVGITEETLARFPYRSPIDRGFLASLIANLRQCGVRAIGLDVVLDRPTEQAKDDALRQALLGAGVPAVAISVAPDTPMEAEQRRFLAAFLNGVRTGDANLVRDRFDDTVRIHVPRNPETGAPSFPAAVAEAAGAAPPSRPFPIAWRRAVEGKRAGRDVTTYSAEAVALLPPAWLRGKIVLIGALVPGSDEHRTPASLFGPSSFGVDIHARVLSQMLDGAASPADASRTGIAVTCVLAIAGLLLGSLWPGAWSVAAIVLTGLIFLAVSLFAYSATGILVPLVPPVLALAMTGGAARARRGMADRRDRRALRTIFSRFVSAPVVEQIMKDRDLFMAGGRPRPQELTATVLYADIAGFTGICESLAPEPLIAWLDAYLEAMTTLIMGHGGVVLRFIGDGILAVFGVPVPRRTEAEVAADARNAALCALDMEQAMARLNADWAARGLPVGGLRVGLHTGPMVAGSLGKGERLEFCLLGDTANVGARLEQLGKEFADPDPRYCTIVIGQPTRALLGASFPALHVGEMPLRGRKATLAAYRIDSGAVGAAKSPGPTCPSAHPHQ